MNTWLPVVVAVISVLVGTAVMLRWVVSTLDSRIDASLAYHLTPRKDRIDEQGRSLDERIDA